MRKSRFSESQIVDILKEAESGIATHRYGSDLTRQLTSRPVSLICVARSRFDRHNQRVCRSGS
jgi:hypothetical protein